MKNSLYVLRELRREMIIRERNHDYKLTGKTGHCFIKGDKVIKLYNYPKKESKLNDLTKYKADRISFPIDYIYEKGKIIGEILPYYKADTIDISLNSRSKIKKFFDTYGEVEEEIKEFPHILMSDIWAGNILYSERQGMFLIDTTDWSLDEEENSSLYNINRLDSGIFFALRNLIQESTSNLSRIQIQCNSDFLNYLYAAICEGESLLEILKEYREIIKKSYSYEMKNIADMKKYTKIMKKR